MAGHSKWAQIKRQKGVNDVAKSRVFSRLAREIALEAKRVGGNVSSPTVSAIIARAKAVNMPKENIERAVAKGTSKELDSVEQVVYELYGPGAVAIIIRAFTDNRNRTMQSIKTILTKLPYELGVQGSASWAFARLPDGGYTANEPLLDISPEDEEKLADLLSHFDELDDVQEVYTNALGYESTR